MYLSDKRPINLFGLSPTPSPQARGIKAASSNLLVYRRYGCRGFRERLLPISADRIPEARRKRGNIAGNEARRRGTLVSTLPRIPWLCRGYSYEFFHRPRHLVAVSRVQRRLDHSSWLLYSQIAISRGKLVPRVLYTFVAWLTGDRLKDRVESNNSFRVASVIGSRFAIVLKPFCH